MTARKSSQTTQKVDVVHINASIIKWVAGFFAAIFSALLGWWAVSDHVDNHWLTTAKAKVKFQAIDRTNAWVLFSIQDFKAAAADKWLEDCRREARRSKTDPSECQHLQDQAAQFKQEAMDMKKEAGKASKPPADE